MEFEVLSQWYVAHLYVVLPLSLSPAVLYDPYPEIHGADGPQVHRPGPGTG